MNSAAVIVLITFADDNYAPDMYFRNDKHTDMWVRHGYDTSMDSSERSNTTTAHTADIIDLYEEAQHNENINYQEFLVKEM